MDAGKLTRKERRSLAGVTRSDLNGLGSHPQEYHFRSFCEATINFLQKLGFPNMKFARPFCLKQRLATIEHKFRFLPPQVHRKLL